MKNQNKCPFTFGWELEATSSALITPAMIEKGGDGSVDDEGVEYKLGSAYVSDPFTGIMALRNLLSIKGIKTNNSCGFHVHISLAGIGKLDDGTVSPSDYSKLKSFGAWCVAFGKQVEESVFKLVPVSRRTNDTCRRWRGQMNGITENNYPSRKYDSSNRYNWINITEIFRPGGIGTVEFRLMGDSSNFQHLFSWVCLCMLIGKSALRLMEDPSRLEYETYKIDCVCNDFSAMQKSKETEYSWTMGQETGILPYNLKNFESFINPVPDPSMPDKNPSNESNEEIFRRSHRYGINNSNNNSGVRATCICNYCNYWKWHKMNRIKDEIFVPKKNKKIIETIAAEPASLDASYEQMGRILSQTRNGIWGVDTTIVDPAVPRRRGRPRRIVESTPPVEGCNDSDCDDENCDTHGVTF